MQAGFQTNVHRSSSRSSSRSSGSAPISSSTKGVGGRSCRFWLLSEITRKLAVDKRSENRGFSLRRRFSLTVLVEDPGVKLSVEPFLPSVGDLICTISEVSDEFLVCEDPTSGPYVGLRPGEFVLVVDARRCRWPVLSKECEDVRVGVLHPAAGYPHTPTLRVVKHIRYANTSCCVSASIVFGSMAAMKSYTNYKAYGLADCGQATRGARVSTVKGRDGVSAPPRDWHKANMRLTLTGQERSERLKNWNTGNDSLTAFLGGFLEVYDGGE